MRCLIISSEEMKHLIISWSEDQLLDCWPAHEANMHNPVQFIHH